MQKVIPGILHNIPYIRLKEFHQSKKHHKYLHGVYDGITFFMVKISKIVYDICSSIKNNREILNYTNIIGTVRY